MAHETTAVTTTFDAMPAVMLAGRETQPRMMTYSVPPEQRLGGGRFEGVNLPLRMVPRELPVLGSTTQRGPPAEELT